MSLDYRVRLDAFEGPLDLLLYLIRRAEVEVVDIPIAAIADQYLEFLNREGVEHIDIETAGEFLVMAATLMEIKSRMLTPQPPSPCVADAGGAPRETEDPRAELVRQLLAYKKFRDVADQLEGRKREWESKYPAGRAGADHDAIRKAMLEQAGDVELEDVSLVDLARAFAEISMSVNFERLGDHQVTYDDTPIELHAEDILDRLRRAAQEAGAAEAGGGGGGLSLQALFAGRKRGEMIGLFLATLELVKRRAVRLSQDTPGGVISISIQEDAPAA